MVDCGADVAVGCTGMYGNQIDRKPEIVRRRAKSAEFLA